MMHVVEIASCVMIYLPRFMKTGTGVQAILRFCLSNLNGRNGGIANERVLLSVPSRWTSLRKHFTVFIINFL
jgi:hypothetical protein